jgi:hypothetical protein
MSFLISCFQQMKVYSVLLRKFRKESSWCPPSNSRAIHIGYDEATVVDPIKNYYTIPIHCHVGLHVSVQSVLFYPGQRCRRGHTRLIAIQEERKNDYYFVHFLPSRNVSCRPFSTSCFPPKKNALKMDTQNAPTEFERAVPNGRQQLG